MDYEIRSGSLELRAVGRKLTGHAAVFNERADIGGFQEIVMPGAFTRALASGSDVVALLDHNPSQLLGRTASGTLQLSEDHRGLAFSIDAPATSLGNDVLELVRRGDIRGASFSFRATDERWPTRDLRELRAVELHDISLIQSQPAYAGTDVALRSRDAMHRTADVDDVLKQHGMNRERARELMRDLQEQLDAAEAGLSTMTPDQRRRFLARLR
jgi:HK97 family phage prohead protease